MEKSKKVTLDVKKFVLFHRERVSLLKEFAKNKKHGRLIFQISFLGFESLAKLLYPKMKSEERFIELLSLPNMGISEEEAIKLYKYWRCSLTHEGFITTPWTCLEAWGENDIVFLSYPDGLKSSAEYLPESIIAIYESRINYLKDFFRKTNTEMITL